MTKKPTYAVFKTGKLTSERQSNAAPLSKPRVKDLEEFALALPTLEDAAAFLEAQRPGLLHGYGGHGFPAAPTDAAPGSEEKIRILQERLKLGIRLHHPQDLFQNIPLIEEDRQAKHVDGDFGDYEED